MAHEVSFNVPERELARAAVEFKVRHNREIIGRLRVSQGGLEWIGRDKEIGHKLAWREFALIVQGAHETSVIKRTPKQKRQGAPKPRGLKTPQRAFRLHILQVLQKLGGSADAKRVQAELEKFMTLNAYDLEPLQPAKPGEKRWWKSAQFERFMMVKAGLLFANSPRGIWQITDAGRKEATTTT